METKEHPANLRFFYNGIKGADGRLQKCSYSNAQLVNFPSGTITIYGRDYERFSLDVHAAFMVQNDSDSMTDYFENSRMRVEPSHPLYDMVSVAMAKETAHSTARAAKWAANYLKRQGVTC